ncbi:UvrD-helicase domain-containing protein [Actinomadura sp. 3N508]|uniref:UvrD-helicase domain-containing protein n=1 Tax=Actinomadura sp. 3N508 TaxID=3375153 RepID=UPI003796312B
MTPSHDNRAVIAAAGSGKTGYIAEQALSRPDQSALVTTYTNENLYELRTRLCAGRGTVPAHIDTKGWLTFLLNECARPYQDTVFGEVGVIRGLHFEKKANRYVPKINARRYYLNSRDDVYRDELSALVCEANDKSGGMVIDRLAAIYDHIYVDELQDLAGYDLQLLDLLLSSAVGVTMVGDPRQGTYSTNDSRKNHRFKRGGVVDWLGKMHDRCTIENRTGSYRCNQEICDFADALYPGMPRTESKNGAITGHDGIFYIKRSQLDSYVQQWHPAVLRWDIRTNTHGLEAINIGQSKGRTYKRVLIFPTAPMKKYLATRDLAQIKDPAKFYVAVTRAQYSVTFVMD